MHRLGIMLLMGIALFLVGCARTLGPVPMPMARVRGVVHDGNGPVSGGWIEFMPVDGTVGNLRSARLGPDGSFDAEGVPVGEVAIRLVNDRIDQDRVLAALRPVHLTDSPHDPGGTDCQREDRPRRGNDPSPAGAP